MADSKETEPPQETKDDPKATVLSAADAEGEVDDEQSQTATSTPRADGPSSASKSKKKKKKSKLKTLLDRKANEEIPLSEVEEALKSATLEERKTLSKEQAAKLEFMIKKMNEFMPGGRKNMGDHKFWKTQPVIKFGIHYLSRWLLRTNHTDEIVEEEGPIEPPRPDLIEKEKKDLKLPKDLEFVEIDMTSETEVQEVYELLSGHYVEDDDAAFRFKYSASFLKWCVSPVSG